MPFPQHPGDAAVENALNMVFGKGGFAEWMSKNVPAQLGEGPVPERRRRIGELPADPFIEQVASLIPEEDAGA